MFFRDVLRVYDKSGTALKIHSTPAGARVTIGVCEACEIRESRLSRLLEIKAQRKLH